jgi:hypothetical protein
MNCPTCDEPLLLVEGSQMQTLVGYGYYGEAAKEHNHDDNCRHRTYICKNKHQVELYKQNKCFNPKCDWVGKEECFCHKGKKLKEWPEAEISEVTIYEIWGIKDPRENKE